MTDTPRSEALDVAALALDRAPALTDDEVIEGDPSVASRELWPGPGGEGSIGVWEITPGTVRDVEADETFVVVHGEATVELDDGRTLQLGPGSVGRLRAGERTVWRVTQTLRKVYVIER